MCDTDPHCRSLGEAKRDHECDRCQLQRNPMRGKFDCADNVPISNDAPVNRLTSARTVTLIGRPRWRTSGTLPVGPPETDEELVALRLFAGLQVDHHGEEAHPLYDDGDDCGPCHSKRRKTEMAKHKAVGSIAFKTRMPSVTQSTIRARPVALTSAAEPQRAGRQKAELNDAHITGRKLATSGFCPKANRIVSHDRKSGAVSSV